MSTALNQEDQIGTPASHGCIRLRNLDMVNLFDKVVVGDRLKSGAREALISEFKQQARKRIENFALSNRL